MQSFELESSIIRETLKALALVPQSRRLSLIKFISEYVDQDLFEIPKAPTRPLDKPPEPERKAAVAKSDPVIVDKPEMEPELVIRRRRGRPSKQAAAN